MKAFESRNLFSKFVQRPFRKELDTRPHPRWMLLISSQNTFVTIFATSFHIQVNILRTTEEISAKQSHNYQQNSQIFHDENTQSYWSFWTAGEITLIKDHLPPDQILERSSPWSTRANFKFVSIRELLGLVRDTMPALIVALGGVRARIQIPRMPIQCNDFGHPSSHHHLNHHPHRCCRHHHHRHHLN